MVPSKPVVVFRADGSSSIGLGHLFRCAALASMLSLRYSCILATRECPTAVLQTLISSFEAWWNLSGLSEEKEFERLTSVGKTGNPNLVVLDGYDFDTEYQRRIKLDRSRLMCIDDIHSYEFVSDLVINHAPNVGLVSKYDLTPKTATAFGLGFSLLREPFLQAARENKGVSRNLQDPFYISFGGADIFNVSGRLIRRLAEAGYSNRLMVVLGAANQHAHSVLEEAKRYPGEVVIHESLDDATMIGLYRQAALAFLPASTTLLEAMAVGVPTLVGYYVPNQFEIYHGFVDGQMTYGIGDWNTIDELDTGILRSAIDQAIANGRGKSIIDGFSNLNLISLFDQLVEGDPLLVGRPATDREALIYFNWVNEAAVRTNSINQAPIPYADHLRWYGQKLQSADSLMLYYEHRSRPCGQIRFDLNDRQEALLDYSIDRDMRGRGFGSRILSLGEQQLRARFPTTVAIIAIIKLENVASYRALRAVSYEEAVERETVPGFTTYKKILS